MSDSMPSRASKIACMAGTADSASSSTRGGHVGAAWPAARPRRSRRCAAHRSPGDRGNQRLRPTRATSAHTLRSSPAEWTTYPAAHTRAAHGLRSGTHRSQRLTRMPLLPVGVRPAERSIRQTRSRRPMPWWAVSAPRTQQSNTDQQMSFRNLWSSSTSSRIASGRVTLPLALESPCSLALALRRGDTCGPDRVGGRPELVRGDVGDSSQRRRTRHAVLPHAAPGRAHRMAPPAAQSLHHRDLTTHPGAGLLDRLTRPRVLWLSRLEEVKDVLRARGGPQSKETVIGIGERPTTADRHEAWVPASGRIMVGTPSASNPPTTDGAHARPTPGQACELGGRIRKFVFWVNDSLVVTLTPTMPLAPAQRRVDPAALEPVLQPGPGCCAPSGLPSGRTAAPGPAATLGCTSQSHAMRVPSPAGVNVRNPEVVIIELVVREPRRFGRSNSTISTSISVPAPPPRCARKRARSDRERGE